jgi:protein phosphatase 1L
MRSDLGWWLVSGALLLIALGIIFLLILPVLLSWCQRMTLPSVSLLAPAPGVGICSIQGRRKHMEDAFTAKPSMLQGPAAPPISFFAVYDGHGGALASAFLAEDLHKRIASDSAMLTESPGKALEQAFRTSENELLRRSTLEGWYDGSTACAALLADGKMYVANVGDSRAVLGRKNGTSVPLSKDHKPSDEEEKKRVEALGGRIIHMGIWRVEGVLGLTRAFGDRHLKEYVTATPDVSERALGDEDAVLIIGSDGLWDTISSQQAVELVLQVDYRKDPDNAAKILTQTAFLRGSGDNITCIVVDLQRYRNVFPSRNGSS